MSGDLDHSPADIIRHLLVDLAAGTLPEDNGSWPIFASFERDNPDDVVTIYDTTPITHGRHHVNGETQQHYGIQARIRGKDQPTAFLKAIDLTNKFDAVERNTVNVADNVGTATSTYLVQAVHHSGILSIGLETTATRRRIFTINALVALRMTS